MTDREIILHGLRDRDDEGRAALKRLVERAERAEAELSHSILDATAVLVEGKAKAERDAQTERENCAIMAGNWRRSMNECERLEARVKKLKHLLALVEDDVSDAHTLGLVRAAIEGVQK